MKKILLTAVLALVTAVSASAVDIDIKYKGYVDTGGGLFFPSTDETEVDGLGYNYAISTTHGIELFKGLFLGAGFEANLLGYYEKEYPGSYNDSSAEIGGIFTVFAEARYNILRTKKISPFVGLRIGGGYQGMDEEGCFHFAPMAGCTFNFTNKFGLDVGLRYGLYSSGVDEDYDYYDSSSVVYNTLNVFVGIHF